MKVFNDALDAKALVDAATIAEAKKVELAKQAAARAAALAAAIAAA